MVRPCSQEVRPSGAGAVRCAQSPSGEMGAAVTRSQAAAAGRQAAAPGEGAASPITAIGRIALRTQRAVPPRRG